MKKLTYKNVLVLLALLCTLASNAQDTASPYHTDFWTDGAWLAGSLGVSAYGLVSVINKDDLTLQELQDLNEDDIIGIDRWAAGYRSESANRLSDIPFYTSFATPFLFLFNQQTRKDAGQLSVLFVETMATTSALFTVTAGLVQRSRPLVYDPTLEIGERLDNDNQRSFYSGHVAASAAATFFAAKVFSDYFPDSKAKPFVWAGAALTPAVVGYFRIESGNHFLTDVLLGYGLGAAAGILVPELHKKKDNNLKVSAGINFEGQQTFLISYDF